MTKLLAKKIDVNDFDSLRENTEICVNFCLYG